MEWWKYTFSKTIFHFESQIMCLQKSILSQIKSNSTKNKIKIIKRKKMINKIKWKTNNQNNWNKGTEKKTKAKKSNKITCQELFIHESIASCVMCMDSISIDPEIGGRVYFINCFLCKALFVAYEKSGKDTISKDSIFG